MGGGSHFINAFDAIGEILCLFKHKADVYMCIYIFVCMSELIEETGRFPNLLFWHIGVTFGTRQEVEVSTQNFSHLDKSLSHFENPENTLNCA